MKASGLSLSQHPPDLGGGGGGGAGGGGGKRPHHQHPHQKDLIMSKDYSFDQKFNISAYISSPQDAVASSLRKHVEEEARELSGEGFSRFMDQLYDQILNLLESSDTAENVLALRAIDALIDVPYGENASKVSKFSTYLRMVFEAKREPKLLVLASSVLGHLARAGGAMTADEVECQV